MRPEDKEDDYIEDKEAGNEDTEETTETDKDAAEQDGGATVHSDYKVPDKGDARVTYHLSGMYQNWFLDYASYVILERAVPHINDGLKPVQRRILHSMRRLEDGRFNKVANIVGHTMQFPRHGVQPQDDPLATLLRRAQPRAGHPAREISLAAGARRGGHRGGTLLEDIAAQLQ